MKKSIVMSIGLSTVALAMGATDAYAAERGTVTTDVLNVRSAPSTSNSIVGKLYRGNTVDILESSNGWHKVKMSNGQTGWASSDYIKIGSSNNAGGSTEESVSGYGTVTTSSLNVRSGASTSYSVISKVYKNDTVELLAKSNGWYKIKLSNGQIGWASGDYIKLGASNNGGNNNNGGGSTEESVSGYGTVTASSLNIRSGASTSYSVVAKAYRNDTVELLAKSNGWYKVKLSNGQIGWASDDYIKLGASSGGGSTENKPSNARDAVVNLAKQQIGKPYVWGAEGPNSFDCSGLTYYVYKNAAGVTLPRTSREQSTFGTTVSRSNLQPGDLVFSSTDGSGNVSHVGIYIGNGEMIHSPKPGDVVQRTNMNSSYWNSTYLWAKRVL